MTVGRCAAAGGADGTRRRPRGARVASGTDARARRDAARSRRSRAPTFRTRAQARTQPPVRAALPARA
jgi:hypothetical protein